MNYSWGAIGRNGMELLPLCSLKFSKLDVNRIFTPNAFVWKLSKDTWSQIDWINYIHNNCMISNRTNLQEKKGGANSIVWNRLRTIPHNGLVRTQVVFIISSKHCHSLESVNPKVDKRWEGPNCPKGKTKVAVAIWCRFQSKNVQWHIKNFGQRGHPPLNERRSPGRFRVHAVRKPGAILVHSFFSQ